MIKFLLFLLVNISSMLHAMDLSDCKTPHRDVHDAVRTGMPIEELSALMVANYSEPQYKYDPDLVVLLATHKTKDEIIDALQYAQYLYDHKESPKEKASIQHAIFKYLDEALDLKIKIMSNLKPVKKPRLDKTFCSCGKDASDSVKRQFYINGDNKIFCNACRN